MRSQRLNERSDETTRLLVFGDGDEIVATLLEFSRREGLRSGRFSAIGAVSDLVLGYFDVEKREYRKLPFPEQVEILVLTGNITEADAQPRVHAHLVAGRPDGTTLGGHLLEARVRPTLEMFLTAWPTTVRRRLDERSGLMLIGLP